MAYVGVMGGTFDPIHFGHLAAAEGARQMVGLDRVLFMPNQIPPHKESPGIRAQDRAAMVQLAIADNDALGFCDLELRRSGPSYTIDTVQVIMAEHPDWRLAFLVGMDNLLQIKTWRSYELLLNMVDLLVITRPGYSTADGSAMLKELGTTLAARIRLIETPGLAISSKDLRQISCSGRSLRYLVPDRVVQYIREHRLYER